jgi:uncharacterized protein YndB with AHSA1/START domain
MMTVEFEVTGLIAATPQEIYDAWLNSEGHAAMTGSPAQASAVVGDSFTAWDGYIRGQNQELEPGKRILQTWRTTEFEESDPDSRLEILLQSKTAGTLVTIRHSNLPDHGMQYQQGWVDAYFTPMQAYFGRGEAAGIT